MSLRRLLLALVAVAGGLLLAARALGPFDATAVGAAIAAADARLLVAAVGFVLLTITARTLRAILILRAAGAEASRAAIGEVFLVGWWLNTVLPARAGDAYRIAALRATSGGGRAIGSLVAERAMDLVVVAIIAAVAVTARFGDRIPPAIALAVAIAAAIAIAAFALLLGARRFAERLPHPALRRAADGIGTVTVAFRPVAGRAIALTIIGWVAEVGRFACVAYAIGSAEAIGFGGIAAAAIVAALLSTVPFSPAGLGIAEAGVAVMTTAAGVPPEIAAAAVIIDRACSTGVIVLGGIPVAARRLTRGRGR